MLTVAYDGTNYCGWQIQPSGETIEGVLNRELSRLLQEEIRVIGASRTDSGVHAKGQSRFLIPKPESRRKRFLMRLTKVFRRISGWWDRKRFHRSFTRENKLP